MNVLIVDDLLSTREVIAGIVEDIGHHATAVGSGEDAVALIRQGPLPDLIILDINMPGMDGYEAARHIRDIAGNTHLPIIFLTGATDNDVLTRCLAIGDDYIKKPFAQDVIVAKTKAHLRVSQIYQQLEKQHNDLKHFQSGVDAEHSVVETIFANHFEKHIVESDNLRSHISSVSVFNGDVLLTALGPGGSLYAVIGDVTGHGLPAAVGAIPAYGAFRTMAMKGLGVGTIASEMNKQLRTLLPDHMMMAAAIIELSANAAQLTVWCGGMPAMIIDDGQGGIKQTIVARHAPLAAEEAEHFSQDVEVFAVDRGDRVFLFTDGVEEARDQHNRMFGEDRLHAMFDGNTVDVFDRILESLGEHTSESEQDDDITLVQLTCEPDSHYKLPVVTRAEVDAIPWKLEVQLDAQKIRATDPVPQIIQLVSNSYAFDVHQDYVSTILSELYSNALEHGLLGLDSAIKQTDDGFIDYYEQRRDRLQALEHGSIHITVELSTASFDQVAITITDTGDGFDYQKDINSAEDNAFGRGTNIVNELCNSNIEYSNGGRTVTAVYTFEKSS